MEKKTENILSTILSVVGGILAALCLLLFWLKSKHVISSSDCNLFVKILLSIIALLAGLFSVATKKAPYRGGLADKNENVVEYYVMTAIWFSLFMFFLFIAIAK